MGPITKTTHLYILSDRARNFQHQGEGVRGRTEKTREVSPFSLSLFPMTYALVATLLKICNHTVIKILGRLFFFISKELAKNGPHTKG